MRLPFTIVIIIGIAINLRKSTNKTDILKKPKTPIPKNLPIPKVSYRYLLLYKPYGVLCQFTEPDPQNPRPNLKDYVPVSSVYPAGRLDFDSEGLLLLTNDGKLQHRLLDPNFAHPRTYWVQVERIPEQTALQKLRLGITIQNQQTRPALVEILPDEPKLPPRNPPIRYRKNVPTAWLEMTLTEGKNRQVRRMTAAIGYPTLRLIRVALGPLNLENLQPGEWRDLTASEIKQLQELASKPASVKPNSSNKPKQKAFRKKISNPTPRKQSP